MLSVAQGRTGAVEAAIRYVAAHQEPSGAIPWFPGGETDPWDHVECAMALDVGGRHREAEAAYRWLREVQLDDGSFWSRTRNGTVVDGTKDTNLSTYVAVGVWHHFRITGDGRFLREMWPTVTRALDFALRLQGAHGGIHWASDAEGRVWDDCLVTGCSSIRAALVCGERLATIRGDTVGGRWGAARTALEEALRAPDDCRFGWSWGGEKDRFAMDWYYPVLCGVLTGHEAWHRIDRENGRFLRKGLGCLCRDDQDWITIAESCELALALHACGRDEEARRLLEWQLVHQERDGGFRTGTVPGYGPWPDEERPSWTAAVMVLTADALFDVSPASDLFRSLQWVR